MSSHAHPTWSRWSQVHRVVLHPPYLHKTLLIALVVGTVLFGINHLDEVLMGKADRVIWTKSALTYLVPLVVSNLGLLVGSRAEEK